MMLAPKVYAHRATPATALLTKGFCLEDDPPKEECQEGYSVLLDGLRSVRYWYVTNPRDATTSRCIMNTKLTTSIGRTTFVNTLCGKDVLTHKDSDDASSAHVEDGVKIKPVTVGAYTNSNDLQSHIDNE